MVESLTTYNWQLFNMLLLLLTPVPKLDSCALYGRHFAIIYHCRMLAYAIQPIKRRFQNDRHFKALWNQTCWTAIQSHCTFHRPFPSSFYLCFKTSPSTKPFMWKWVLLTSSFRYKTNSFSYERFHTLTHFKTVAKGNSEMACWVTSIYIMHLHNA